MVTGVAAVADAGVWNHWVFVPGVVAGLTLLAVAYALAATRFRGTLVRLGGPAPPWPPPGALSRERTGRLAPRQVAAFYGGLLVAGLALLSPLHPLGERYLLSAHMTQHLLISQAVPPLLLLGVSGWMLRPLLRLPAVRGIAGRLLTPIPAFLLFNLVLLAWHAPPIYELSLTSDAVHALQHGLFLGLGLLLWWPVVGPLAEFPRLPHGGQVLYLFFASLPPTILGAVITLAGQPLYSTYWAAPRVLGLSAADDQQLGGLIMWIPGALAYFLALSVVFFLWVERRGEGEPAYGTVNPDRARQQTRPQLEGGGEGAAPA